MQIIAAGGTEVAANADPRMKDPFFRKFFGPPPSQEAPPSIGSGFILDDSGLVVTNLHVVRNAKNVQVILADGTKVPGVIRGSDEWTDIAVIQMKNAKNIRPARLGDSDKVYVGDYVVALGNPFGLQGTFSTGVVSAVARSVPGDPGMKFLQTDAAINPGNSGGPLINLDGEVIGINRMIVSPAGGSVGIGFAIPINEVKKVKISHRNLQDALVQTADGARFGAPGSFEFLVGLEVFALVEETDAFDGSWVQGTLTIGHVRSISCGW